MSQYLLLFSITPVQAYIEQSRKTQDLYAGSYILSHLCRTAIKTSQIADQYLMFPKLDPNRTQQSLPNRFIGVVQKGEPELREYGKAIEDAVTDEFMAIADTACEVLKKHGVPYREQIKNYLTCHWIFLPVENNYTQVYAKIEQLHGSLKQVRAFEQLPEDQWVGRKCSVCGERNVVIYRKNKKEDARKGTHAEINAAIREKKLFLEQKNHVYLAEYKEKSPIQPKFLHPGEGLCAVCYTKRSAEAFPFKNGYDPKFPSTSNVALLDARNHKIVDKTVCHGKDFDGNYIFARYNKQSDLSEYDATLSDSELRNSKAIYQELKDKVELCPYYAMLHFDGDSMGRWLSGEFLRPPDAETLQRFHQTLSGELMTFAGNAQDYFRMNGSKGQVIYAGGDDFLGILSLCSLFPAMMQLRKEFDRIDLSEFSDRKLTFSAGAVIAHYRTPLSAVLHWARAMEKEAKELDKENKDAFSLAVLKHSGEIHKTRFKWHEGDDSWTLPLFENICKAITVVDEMESSSFSGAFLKTIDAEFRPIMNHKGSITDIEFIDKEIERLVRRACQLPKESKDTEQAIRDVSKNIIELHARSLTFENFLYALGIIDFLTRKETL